MGDQIRNFEAAMSSQKGPPVGFTGDAGTVLMLGTVKGRMQFLLSNFISSHSDAAGLVEDLWKDIYELRLKENGLALTRQSLELTRKSLHNSRRAFRLSVIALAITVLFGIASKVFEPTFTWLSHHVPQLTDKQTAPSATRVPPLSLLK